MSRFDALSILTAAIAIAIALLTFRDYGIGWDEEIQQAYGAAFLDGTAMQREAPGAAAPSPATSLNLHLYGGLFEWPAAALARALPYPVHETRHLLGALVGVLAALGGAAVGRRLAGPRAGFLALLFLLITPRLQASAPFNSKDVPFAAGYVWSLYFFLRVIERLPRPRWRDIALLGVATGAALAVRAGALVVLAYISGAFLIALSGRDVADRGRTALRLAGSAALVYVVALAVMWPFWPWAQANPILRPIEALRALADFQYGPATVPFAGETMATDVLPTHYGVTYLWRTAPLFALAGWTLLFVTMKAWVANPVDRRRVLAVTVFALFPFVYVAARGSVLYNAIRQLLFAVLPCIVLAAFAFDRAVALGPRASRAIVAALLVGAVGWQVNQNVQLHPYAYVHYNVLAGGAANAAGRYDLDYWRVSYREAIELLRRRLEHEAHPHRPADYQLFLDGNLPQAATFFPDYLAAAVRIEDADFILSANGYPLFPELDGPAIVEVQRGGVVLCRIRDRRAAVGRVRSAPMAGSVRRDPEDSSPRKR